MVLNESQRTAAEYGIGDSRLPAPLLIIAGAGTGKTKTLAHRVAHLVSNGIDPRRILLLTFTRRAAAEMTRRAARILGEARHTPQRIEAGVAVDDIVCFRIAVRSRSVPRQRLDEHRGSPARSHDCVPPFATRGIGLCRGCCDCFAHGSAWRD